MNSSAGPIFKPGGLVRVGPALHATGGVVSNTGLALHRLGFEPRLVGRVGDDWIGREILAILRSHGARFVAGMRIVSGDQSSYTIVLSPPGVDRIFLHCPGANDAFSAADVDPARLGAARLFHFGYPPVMRRMYGDAGRELALLFRRVKRRGLVTSLDMAGIDASSEAGRVDWDALLRNVLPFVDLFLPSIDEMVQMLAPELVGKPGDQPDRDDPSGIVDGPLLRALADRLLGYGAAVVGLKLGTRGFYLRTTADRARLAGTARALPLRPEVWLDRELLVPSFRVRVAGTTGAGDCAIAGFLAAVMRGLGPEDALRSAAGAGACCVEKADAVSGVPSWSALWKRLNAGWSRYPIDLPLPGWRWDNDLRLWRGPGER
ncbi:MAG: carbohydrate kinase family protein [Candidatus Aminicenantes bacterium]|nr:carbohydrate kinase family protein [Candidatus Aminicenantes bacterium]